MPACAQLFIAFELTPQRRAIAASQRRARLKECPESLSSNQRLL